MKKVASPRFSRVLGTTWRTVSRFREKHPTLDELTFRFGMREIGVKGGDYQLNSRRLWLRGSNLVFEWNWGGIVDGKEKDYLVTEAREMSINSFRTQWIGREDPAADQLAVASAGRAPVARVDFYKGGSQSQDGDWKVWLGQVTKPPCRVTWPYDPTLEYDPAGGEFIITARVTDDRGASAHHSVNITISGKQEK